MAEKLDYGYSMPTISTPKDELLKITVDWEKESGEYHSQLKAIQDANEQYYMGNQTEKNRVPRNQCNSVENRIFMGVETVIPIITANPPQFIAEPTEESDQAINYARSIEKTLSIGYEEKDIRSKGEMLIRHMVIFRFGAWIPFWNKTTNDVDVEWVRPQQLYFPKTSKFIYYYRKKDFTTEEIETEFGKAKLNEYLKYKYPNKEEKDYDKIKELCTLWEFHTKDITFWKVGAHILDVKVNETYNFDNEENNFFNEPKLPIIVASAFRLGDQVIGNTDLIQQTIPIQDDINSTTRIIVNHAQKTGNGRVLVDTEVMSDEEARTKITNKPGEVIVGPGVANSNKFRLDTPPALPNYIPDLKVMKERAFDNIFGTHSTTRGERGESETLGGRMLLKQSDYGRIDLLVREYERCVSELGNWWAQLLKINLEGRKTYRAYGEAGTEFVNIEANMISKGTKIIIKSGTTLPTDEVSKRQEAIQLWGMGALDPETLFERLKFPNPQEAAKRLQLWRMNQLQMDMQTQGSMGQNRQRTTKPQPTGLGEVGAMAKTLSGQGG